MSSCGMMSGVHPMTMPINFNHTTHTTMIPLDYRSSHMDYREVPSYKENLRLQNAAFDYQPNLSGREEIYNPITRSYGLPKVEPLVDFSPKYLPLPLRLPLPLPLSHFEDRVLNPKFIDPVCDNPPVGRITYSTPLGNFETKYDNLHAHSYPESHNGIYGGSLLRQKNLDTGYSTKIGTFELNVDVGGKPYQY